MGPRKPSTGKTNSYRLTDKSGKKAIQVQVYNTGKSYELNMYKEDVQLDEAPRRKGAPKMTGDSVAIQRAKDAELNKAHGRTKTGRKKPVRTMTSTQRSLASLRREFVEDKTFEPHMMYDPKTGEGKKAEVEADHLKMKKMGWSHEKPKTDSVEESKLDEAFKAGGLKLKDGKQVLIKKNDAMMLNDLMKQLSKPNVKKMTDTAMKNKKGFEEILGFARDSHE